MRTLWDRWAKRGRKAGKSPRRPSRAQVFEPLEPRQLLASDWQNPYVPLDVSHDGLVVPIDALLVINEINNPTVAGPDGRLPDLEAGTVPVAYLDTSGDSVLAPIDVLLVINAINTDDEPPAVTVGLVRDTAPGGTTNSDGITSDAAIRGRVSDLRGVADLRVRVDGGDFQPVVFARDGSFTLDLGLVPGSDDEGPHRLEFQATDAGARTTAAIPLQFTFDTLPPAAARLDLASTSDGEVRGDGQTNAAYVTLIGQSEAHAVVTLTGLQETSFANSRGTFQFPRLALAAGDNTYTMRVSDQAGNTAEFTQTMQRSGELPGEDMVLRWNLIALDSVARDATTPPQASRNLALVSVAVYDALMALEGSQGIYTQLAAPAGTSSDAAAAAAAHRVLVALYPAQKALLDAALDASLSHVPPGDPRTQGLALGRSAADQVLAVRAGDGWDRVVEYDEGSAAGDWQATAPLFDVPLLPQWPYVEPFTMESQDQFRPAGPPSLASSAWAAAYEEVRRLGSADSTQRTAEQTQIARFWADGRGTDTPPGHWNRIAAEAGRSAGNSKTVNARMLLELNFALADAGISSWDAKYAHGFWRPITAIQAGDTDGNSATVRDASWQPLLVTPNFPEYTSGHSTFSGAAAAVLSDIYGEEFSFSSTSWSLPGVTRTFDNFAAAAAEAGMSRIYGGIHYKFSNEDGLAAGKAVGEQVADRLSVAKDDQPPSIFLDVLPAGASLPASPILRGRVHDLVSGVQRLEVQVNAGEFTELAYAADGTFTFPTSLPSGRHTVGLRARDAWGNLSAVREVSFLVDAALPTIHLVTPPVAGSLAANARVSGLADGTGSRIVSLTYAWDNGQAVPLPFTAEGAFDQALDLSRLAPGPHTLRVTARDSAGNTSVVERTVALAQAAPFQVRSLNPSPGSANVGVTVRPQVVFSRPVDASSLNDTNFFATGPAGQKLPATIVPATDGSFAWLFFRDPMPGGATITVQVLGDTIRAQLDGAALDADGNGTAGGSRQYRFTTVPLSPVPGTTLVGVVADPGPDLQMGTVDDTRPGPDGQLMTADDVFLSPLSHVKVYAHGQESQAVFTDAQGRFELTSLPAGNVKLVVDGMTADNAAAGFYFPEMVLDLYLQPGRANTVMSAMEPDPVRAQAIVGTGVYLPRLHTDILQTVSNSQATQITVLPQAAPNLTAEQQALLKLDVPAGALIGADGQPRSEGQIGISTVPPELVRDMLPPGVLQHTFDITVQAPGITNFATPAPMTFPNVFQAAPGSKLNFLSFDHNTGRLVIEGTVTVSADGKYATTDPGTGITHPGWHGMAPDGGPGCGDSPSPDPDDNQDDDEPPVEDPIEHEPDIFFHVGDAPSGGGVDGEGGPSTSSFPGVTGTQKNEVFRFEWLPPHKPEENNNNNNQGGGGGEGAFCPLPKPNDPKPDDKESQERIEIKIDIKGGLDKWMKKGDQSRPLKSDTITLHPAKDPEKKKVVFSAELKPYKEMLDELGGTADFPLKELNENWLYGAEITLEYKHYNKEGKVDDQHKGFKVLYRFIDATDDKHSDRQLSFEWTAVGASREKPIVYKDVPGSIRPQIEIDPPDIGFSPSGTNIVFQPSESGTAHATLKFKSPRDPSSQLTLGLASVGLPKTRLAIDTGLFRQAIIDTYHEIPNWMQAAEREALEEIVDPLSGRRELDLARVDLLVQNTVAYVTEKLQPFAETITVSTGAGGGPFTVSANDFHPDALVDPPHFLKAPIVGFFTNGGNTNEDGGDMQPDAVRKVTTSSHTWSLAERVFHLSNAINLNSTARVYTYVRNFFNANLLGGTPPLNFTEMVAAFGKTIVHEFGHTLGLVHTWNNKHNRGFDAGDLMRQGVLELTGAGAIDERFNHPTSSTIKLATGGTWKLENEGQAAVDYYTDHFRFQQHGNGLNTFDDDSPPEEVGPPLNLNDGFLLVVGEGDSGSVTRIDFQDVVPGGPAKELRYQLVNLGDQPLRVNRLYLTGDRQAFVLQGAETPLTLQPLESRAITLSYSPEKTGTARAQLVIDTDGLFPRTELAVRGRGQRQAPRLTIDLSRNNAGGSRTDHPAVEVRDMLTFINDGVQPLRITRMAVAEGNSEFSLIQVPEDLAHQPLQLAPGESFSIGVKFKPSSLGLRRAAIEIDSNDPDQPTARFFTVGTGLDRFFHGSWGDDFVAFETPERPNAPVLRAISDQAGRFEIFVPSEREFHLAVYDPQSGLIAHNYAVSAPSGQRTHLTESMDFRASYDADSDGDGVPDDIEFAVGTRSDRRDTDDDGPDDFTELVQKLDPVGGRRLPLGVIASTRLQGEARAVVLAGDLNSRDGQTAFLATGSFGLAIVDASNFTQPVIISELDLPGENQDVAYDPSRNLAVVAGGTAGLHLVDVSNRARPVLQRTVALTDGAQKVEVYGRRIFATSGNSLTEVDALTGEVLQSLELSAGGDIAVSGTTLYALEGRKLQALDLDQVRLTKLGALDLPHVGGSIFVGGGIAYVTRPLVAGNQFGGGFSSVNVSDPMRLQLISGPDNPERAPGQVIAANGSGLALVGDTDGTTQIGVTQVFDVSNPAETAVLVTQFALPGKVHGLAIASGLGYVADDEQGLKVLNYRDFDIQGNPPTVAFSALPADLDPNAPGTQIYEGTWLPLEVTTRDDFQVRQVELLLNGTVIANDVSFPFEYVLPLPRRTAERTTATLQARATDTGGNQATTELVTWELVPDTTPPAIAGANPADGSSAFFIPSLMVEWSESLDPQQLDPAAVSFTFLGADGAPGGGDDLPVPLSRLDLRNRDRVLSLIPQTPPDRAGRYQLSMASSAIADRAGNHPAEDLKLQFTLRPASDVRALVGTPAIARAPSANAGQRIGFKVAGANSNMRMTFPTRDDFSGSLRTTDRFPVDIQGDMIYFDVPENAATGNVSISGDPDGPFPLQIVPTLSRAADGNSAGDWIRGDRLTLVGSGLQEAATTVLLGSLAIVDDRAAHDQLPDIYTNFPHQLLDLQVPIDAPLAPLVVVTEGGRSNALTSDNRLTAIVASAASGMPAEAGAPAANPGQVITIRGDKLSYNSLIAFPTSNLAGVEFLRFVPPTWVSEDGSEALAAVPPNAITGDLRLFGDASGSRARLQIVPVIENVDFHTLQGIVGQNSVVIARFSGRKGMVEDHGTIYRMGASTVVDDGTAGSPDVFSFFADPVTAHVDVRFSAEGDFAGAITVTTAGGTSAPYAVTFTELESRALSGTPANAQLPSANPGQVVTVRGSGLKKTTDFLGSYYDINGNLRYQFLNPGFVSADGTEASLLIPPHFNGALPLRLLGSGFAPVLQIVPTLNDVDVNGVNRIQLHGRGFVEGRDSIYRFAGGDVVDAATSSDPVDVFSYAVENGGVNLTLPRTGPGSLTVTTPGGTSAPLPLHFSNPQLGALYDVAPGSLHVATANRIHRLNTATGQSEFDFPLPGGASNFIGLQLLPEGMNLAGVNVPAGSLLVTNGTPNPDRVYAVEPTSGSVLATLDLVEAANENLDVVAGVYHAPSGRLFLLASHPNQILEVDPASGAVLNFFPAPFEIVEGGLAVHPATGHLWIGSDSSDRLAEMRADGQLIRTYVLPDAGMHFKTTGLAFDSSGKLLVSSARGAVYEISLAPAAPPSPRLESLDAAARTGTPADAQQASANAGQTIALQGQNLRATTQVIFPVRDESGSRYSVTVLPTAAAEDGTELQVVVPDLAETGNISIAEPRAPLNLGFLNAFGDSIYRGIQVRFTPQSGATQIHFTDGGLQDLNDESWGLDNVRVVAVNAPTVPVFEDNFEGGARPEWTLANTDNSVPGSFTEFSGRFNNIGQVLKLNLTPGQEYELTFDFYAIDSWDGTNGGNAGPDLFSVLVDGERKFHEAFSNLPGGLQTFARPDLGTALLQIVPTLTGITGKPGSEQMFELQGSGFMEAGMTLTVGGRTFVDAVAQDPQNLSGDVTGSRNTVFRFGQSLTVEGPITIRTAGGSATLPQAPVAIPDFVDLIGIDSVAQVGVPADAQVPSANVGQNLVLVGRGFRNQTVVVFTATDETGASGPVTVTGTASANGTRLTVPVPTLASTGPIRVIGDSDTLPLQIVPQVRAKGGTMAAGQTVVLDGAGLPSGQTRVTIDGIEAAIRSTQTVYGTMDSFNSFPQQLVDVIVPGGVSAGAITVSTPGGSHSLPLPLEETPANLPDLVPGSDVPETIATALAVQLPSPARVKIAAEVGDGAFGATDVDIFAVTLAKGDRLTAIATADVANFLRISVRVFNAGGQALATGASDRVAAVHDFLAPASGTYFIGVSGASVYDPLVAGSGQFNFETGDYELQLERVSAPLSHLTSIESLAERGTPRVGDVPSAIPGQTVTLHGHGFKSVDRVLFSTGNSSPLVVTPLQVSADGRTMTVTVPEAAQTGVVRLQRDDFGLVLQVVPRLDRVGATLFGTNSFQLDGAGIGQNNVVIEMEGPDLVDAISGNSITSFFSQFSAAIHPSLSLRNLAIRTAGGTSARSANALTELVAAAARGTADDPNRPSANPGQTITLRGTGFHTNTGIIFTTRDVGGNYGVTLVRPETVVSSTELTVAVPLNAATGPVWLAGDAAEEVVELQVVPLITRADVVSIAGERLLVTLHGHSFLEGQDAPYVFGEYTRFDTGISNNLQGIDVKNFFDERFHFADVPLSLAASIFGPISLHVPGGTATFTETVTGFTSVAASGTPANAALPSANPGQLVTIAGAGLDKEVEILFRYTDADGNRKWLAVNPTTVAEDRASASFPMPEGLNGVVEMRILGSTFQRTVQIVPTLSSVQVENATRLRLRGRGFLEGHGSQYDFGGSVVTDESLNDNSVLVFDATSSGNDLVDLTPPVFGLTNLVVTTTGGSSAPFALSMISTGLGRLNDVAAGPYVATATHIHRLDPASGRSLANFAIPGTATTDSVGLQLLPAPITLGGVQVPAGSLLITNGRTNPDTIYAVNPADGSVLTTFNMGGNLDVVAGVYHAPSNRIFVLDGNPNEVVRLNPETGEIITSFSTPFDIAAGGLAIDPVTSNLWIGSSQSSEVAEVNVTGQLQRRVNLTPLGVDAGELTGLAFDAEGRLLVSTIHGFVHRITLPGAALRLDLSTAPAADSSDRSPLDAATLAPLQAEAIRRWAQWGASEAQLARLAQTRIVVLDLSGPLLGWTTSAYVAIDLNGAGRGWFVDATPWEDDEFVDSLQGPHAEEVDLLSVLAHEFGHVLGLDDVWDDAESLLHGSLPVGVRRMPPPR